MHPKISVIVPIYKTEKYIDKCLQSIRQQSMEDLEIICVDDCSPDNSDIIVERHAREDPRVILIRHEKNLGLGGARNTGIEAAKAGFIASVDSDDYIRSNMMEVLWNATEDGKFDVVQCGFDSVDEKGRKISRQARASNVVVNTENSINIFSLMNPAFWNKLWRKSLYTDNNIYFPNHVYYQDTATTPRILAKSTHIKTIDDTLYYYLVRSDSITTTYSSKHIIDYIKVFEVLLSFLKENNIYERYREEFTTYAENGIKYHSGNVVNSNLDEEELKQYLKHLLMFKIAFFDCGEYLDNKSQDELLSLLISAKSKVDLMPDDDRNEVPITLIVKTFLRPKMLERFLLSVGCYEDAQYLRFAEIIIGDDSPRDIIGVNKQVIQKVKHQYPNLKIKHHEYEENIGLSDGRNRMVDSAASEYVFLCDDDFILDEESNIYEALQYLQKDEFDIVGGWLKNKYCLKSGQSVYWGACGEFVETDEELMILLNENEDDVPEIQQSDYLLNFFIAKRKVLINNPWDVSLKIEEHQEFFLRLFHSDYKAAFCKKLFCKHTGDRSDNPKRYNEYRFGMKTQEYYLFEAVRLMGKKRRTIHRWRKNQFITWQVDEGKKTNIQTNVQLKEPVLAQRLEVKRLTPKYNHYFFGYYDVQSVSTDGALLVCQTAPIINSLPKQQNLAEITLIDIKDKSNPLKVLGTTSAWCHQQGAQLQFIPGSSTSIIYNFFDDDTNEFKSRSFDLLASKERVYNLPISALSPDGEKAASLNFSRLYDYRPGYGYGHIPDPYGDQFAPKDDGVFILNLLTNDIKLILSYERIRDSLISQGLSEYSHQKLVVNHVAFNTDSSKLLMLIRTFSGDAPFPTFTMVCDIDGGNLKHVFGFCSHYHWKDKDTFIASGSPKLTRKELNGIKVYEVNTVTLDYKVIGDGVLNDDGHCSYSPDRTMLLYDSYANKKFPYQRLQVFDFETGSAIDLGYFFADSSLYANNADLRCDLHPRWSNDGKIITFDSFHEGYRGIYSINVEDVKSAFGSNIMYFGNQDLRSWYTKKYDSELAITSRNKVSNNSSEGNEISVFQEKVSKVFGVIFKHWILPNQRRKLQENPRKFFEDSRHPFTRVIGTFFKFI